MAAELPHGFEINPKPAASSAFNPFDPIHYFPAVISQFLDPAPILPSAFDIHVSTAGFSCSSTVGDQAL
jgi:hypothetical protein